VPIMAKNKMDDFQDSSIAETVDEVRTVAEGRVFRYERLRVTLPDGSPSERDVVRLPGGSVVVPVDQEGYVYLVSQFRAALNRVTLELPAGRLEPGELPEACAERELLEETGFRAGAVKHLTSVAPSPGYSDEILHIYMATDLEYDEADPDEGEFVNVIMFPMDEIIDMVADGDICDAKTIIGILFAEREMRTPRDNE